MERSLESNGLQTSVRSFCDILPTMPPKALSDAQAVKEAKKQDQEYLSYNLARVDFLLKLLENKLTEKVEMSVTADGIAPTIRVYGIDQQKVPEMREILEARKKELLGKLGILLPR